MIAPRPHSHCHWCGHAPVIWMGDRKDTSSCTNCGNELFRNALTVVVVMIPVTNGDRAGLIVVRRAKEQDPGYNELAFPGGFQGLEDWRKAAYRECAEELGCRLFEPHHLIELHTYTVADGTLNLKFCIAQIRGVSAVLRAIPTDLTRVSPEVSEWTCIWEPTPLAFPTHTDMARAFFRHYGNARPTTTIKPFSLE